MVLNHKGPLWFKTIFFAWQWSKMDKKRDNKISVKIKFENINCFCDLCATHHHNMNQNFVFNINDYI